MQAYDQGYPVTFIIMFLAAFLTGSLAIRIKNQAKQAAQSAYRTKVLFDTNQLLQQAKDKNEIVSATSNQLIKLLGKDIVFYLADGEVLETPHIFSVTEENLESCISENEKAVAGWVLKNNNVPELQQERFPMQNACTLLFAAAVWYMELLES